jgi:hypothetical protein
MGRSIALKNQFMVDRKRANSGTSIDFTFERKLDTASEGLTPEYKRRLLNISKENALIVANYVQSMKIEINVADSYRRTIIKLLTHISLFFNNKKSFEQMEKNDILSFLDSSR